MEYERSTLTEFHLDIFYVLKLLNQMAFGSFILADGFLYVSQITIASPREIERHSEFLFTANTPCDTSREWGSFRLCFFPWGNDRWPYIRRHRVGRVRREGDVVCRGV